MSYTFRPPYRPIQNGSLNPALIGSFEALQGATTISFTDAGILDKAVSLVAAETIAFSNTGVMGLVKGLVGAETITFSEAGVLDLV